MNKAEYRKLVNMITSKSSEEMLEAASSLNQNLSDFLRGDVFRKILFFSPLKDEPQIQPTIQEHLASGRVCLPRMTDNKIVPVEVDSFDDLEMVENCGPKWGPILTPKRSCKPTDLSLIDVAIVPGRAFDKAGVRLGRGKGYYDKFLSSLSAAKVGIGFHFQLFGKLPQEPHDILMDVVITEKVVQRILL